MRNLILSCLKDASHPYLLELLAQTPENQHDHVKKQVESSMNFLADFCLNGYKGPGLLTTDFIRHLHCAIFKPGHRIEITLTDGELSKTFPGEYRRFQIGHPSYLYPDRKMLFYPPEQIQPAMAVLVDNINTQLLNLADISQIEIAILLFLTDFLAIHPFVDANGRVACILADLLAIHSGLEPFYFHRFKMKDKQTLYQMLETVQRTQDLSQALDIIDKYNKERKLR